jgi:O-methyltransferase
MLETTRKLKVFAKKALAPVLYRHRPIGLSAGKLYLYLDAIYRTKDLPGDVLEIGCNVCGTAALGRQMLHKVGSAKKYICVDTFAGFVPDQHAEDVRRGNSGERSHAFEVNSIELARRVLTLHRAGDVELLQADVCQLDENRLPERLSVCLLDVDLYEPIKVGLEKILPRMSPGGFILVDDCNDGPTWRAADAFREFVAEHKLAHRIEFGMGIIELPRAS